MIKGFTFGGGINKVLHPTRLQPDQAADAKNCDITAGVLSPADSFSYRSIESFDIGAAIQGIYRYPEDTAFRYTARHTYYSRHVSEKIYADGVADVTIEREDGTTRPAGRPPVSADSIEAMTLSIGQGTLLALEYNAEYEWVSPASQYRALLEEVRAILPTGNIYLGLFEMRLTIRTAISGVPGSSSYVVSNPGLVYPGQTISIAPNDTTGVFMPYRARITNVEWLSEAAASGEGMIWIAVVKVMFDRMISYIGGPNGVTVNPTGATDGDPPVLQGGYSGWFGDRSMGESYFYVESSDDQTNCVWRSRRIIDIQNEFLVSTHVQNDHRFNLSQYGCYGIMVSRYIRAQMSVDPEETDANLGPGDYFFWFTGDCIKKQNDFLVPIGKGTYKYALTFVDSDGVETSPLEPGATLEKTIEYDGDFDPPVVNVTRYTDPLQGAAVGLFAAIPYDQNLWDGAFAQKEAQVYINGVEIDQYRSLQPEHIVVSGLNGVAIPDWAVKMRIYRTIAGGEDLYLLQTLEIDNGVPEDNSFYDTTPDSTLAGNPLCDVVGRFPPVYYGGTDGETWEKLPGNGLFYHQGRFWLWAKNRLYYSDGTPHYWRLSRFFQFTSDVLYATTAHQYLVVMTKSDCYRITGNAPGNFTFTQLGHGHGVVNPRTVQQWRGAPLWAGADGLRVFMGTEVVNFTTDILPPSAFPYASATIAYVVDDIYHLAVPISGDPVGGGGDGSFITPGSGVGKMRIMRYDLSEQKLLPDLEVEGTLICVFVDPSTQEAYGVIRVIHLMLIRLTGGQAQSYSYTTGRDSADAIGIEKRFNMLMPMIESGQATIHVYVDGVLRKTFVNADDRHHLPDGLRGFDIQLKIEGSGVVREVLYEFSAQKPV